MAFTNPALLTNVLSRVIAILNANPEAFTDAVSGDVGAFPDDDEILLAVLTADGELITRGYFNSVNNTLCEPFLQWTPPLSHNENIAFHYGNSGKAQVSKVLKTFAPTDVNTTTNLISIPGHGLVSGDEISFVSTTTLPAPLSNIVGYFAGVIDANTITVYATYGASLTAASVSPATPIDLTTQGTGTHTMIPWQMGVEAQSLDDINTAIAVGDSYVQQGAFDHLFIISSGTFFHPAEYARIELPQYVRSDVLQSQEADEFLVGAIAIKELTKNASPAPFSDYKIMADEGLQAIIRDGSYSPEDN